ncbi:MAG: amidohydrolase family protein [Actinomycetota bacterium]|nr:amidohydrolase family protein [Actinomycetota bacterium]
MLDLVIRGGTVIDGTGGPPQRAAVGIRDGRIAFVDPDRREALDARRSIDADGLVVSPGFVDIHTHFDAQVFWDPMCSPSSHHGITTVFAGNCGFSIAPISDDPAYVMRLLSKVEGIPLEALEGGVPWNWKGFEQYLDAVASLALGVNIGVSVGHSAIRSAAMGPARYDRDVTDSDLHAMAAMVAGAMGAGAFGFSSSSGTNHLDGDGMPVPSRAAGRDELVALSGTLRSFPGAQLEFIPTNDRFEEDHLETMTAMAVAAQATLNWNILVPRDQDWVDNRMSASDHARARGATVVGLSYPDVQPIRMSFQSVGFHSTAGLDTLPGWADILALPDDQRLAAFRDTRKRSILRRGALSAAGQARNFSAMIVAETGGGNGSYVGRSIGDIAAELRCDAVDVLLDIAVADRFRTLLMASPRAADEEAWAARRRTWKDPRVIIGASDGGAHVDVLATYDYPVRFLARQRELGVLSLPEAIEKLTDVPARLYGATDRGRLAAGYRADIVIFDPEAIAPGALEWKRDLPAGAGRLYSEPVGIRDVIVNGAAIIHENRVTGARPGQLLRRRL